MTLDQLQQGEYAIITGINIDDGLAVRPMVMGLAEGSVVSCLSKLYTTMELNLYGARLAISNHTAKYFTIKIISNADESAAD